MHEEGFSDSELIALLRVHLATLYRLGLARGLVSALGSGEEVFRCPIGALGNPLVHYIRFGRAEGRRTQAAPPERAEALPAPETVDGVEIYPGRLPLLQDAPNILFVAHEAGSTLFGSERYFMEIVACAARLCVNCLACLPARQTAMIGRLLPHTSRVFVFPYPTWNSRRAEDGAVIDRFARLMDDHRVHLVNANTIMLREPLTAARQCGVLRSVNAHEIIQHDPYLMEAIGLDGPQIIGQVRRSADYLIANSRATAETYGMGERSFVVHNPVDGDALNIPNALDGPVRVAMISSNIPKKGLGDFVRLAERCRVRAPSARFVLVGPHNRHVEEILGRKRSGEAGANLEYAGYAEHPVDAIRAGNIVVNLSHFAESFGRTVLEAMAARRAVVAYRWGALPELVEEGETGHLVPYQDVEAAAAVVERLCGRPQEILRLGENGRAKAVAGYGFEALFDVLRRAYGVMLQRTLEARRPRAGGACARPATPPARRDAGGAARALAGAYSVIVPSYNYEAYIGERLESVLAQTCPPREILFLDDASTDQSVLVAEKVLSRSDIPYKIRVNTENQGVYRQWARGIREASAPFVWIAEADDTADPRFAEHLAEIAECDDVALAYAQSRQVDDLGAVLCERNTHHTDDLDPDRWNRDYTENGLREVVDYLCYRNSIPNASACLFRKAFAQDALDRLERFRYCGDWMLYAHLLGRGRVVFRGAPLNGFRRHGRTVTQSRGRSEGYLLELLEVHRFIAERFPIHGRQVDRILAFLDKDYAVEGVPRNSEHPAVREGFASLRALAEPRRRLAFVTTNDGSPVGGSEVLWAEAVKRLRGEGHDVVVLIRRWEPEPPLLQEFRALGVRPYFKEEEGFEAVEWFRPDLVVFSLGDQDEGTEFYARCRRAGLPYVIVNQLTKEAGVWPIREHLQPAVREGYLAARKLYFTCRNNHDVMERRLGCALPHYGVHYNPFHMDRDVRLPFPPPDQGLQVAVPARYLFIHKGQDLLIELMRRAVWRSRRLTLNFYGEGPDEPAIRERIEAFGIRNIRLHGWQKSMLDIWRDNHGILMPSHMEGMPIVLVGAMLCARVPIATRVGGHEEVIDDDRTGFLARSASVEDLDDALGRAYRRREEWEEIGARARQAILAYLPEDPVGDFVSKLLALS